MSTSEHVWYLPCLDEIYVFNEPGFGPGSRTVWYGDDGIIYDLVYLGEL